MRLQILTLAALLLATLPAATQTFDPTPLIPFTTTNPLTIHQPALPNHPLTVTGRSGAILGMQDGTVELWQLPTKFFSALHLRAEVEGYPVPIDLNPLAADLEVAPDHTTLTYAHAAVTVRQHMFVPAADPDNPNDPNTGLGGQILFEVHAIHPTTLIVTLTPALIQMWPAPQWGQPGWGWRPLGSGGAYAIGTDNPHLFGMIAMPQSTPGPISPYQEHPHTLPIEFRVHFDPAKDANHLFPLLCEVNHPGETNTAAANDLLADRIVTTAQQLPQIYARTAAYYAHFFDHRLVPHTPDLQLDRALQWAELSIEQSQATIPAHTEPSLVASQNLSSRPERSEVERPASHNASAEGTSQSTQQRQIPAETGLVAGWYPAFDSARPGFGWFFGRDTLWSVDAIDLYGDPALARRAFQFLIHRQRADGKMPHEFSQTADQLTGDMAWDKLPYEYAAADSNPLFLLALQDYVRATDDTAFLQTNWQSIQEAYTFERTHDSDGDGVYDNSQGTGWVEGWPPKLPHQELYLAALDRDATRAFAHLALLTQHPDLAAQATQIATKLDAAVAAYKLPSGLYAFSKNADGTYDPTETIYPAVAFWLHPDGLPNPNPTLDAWSSHHFATDWGTRSLADTDPLYDPISYHQGSVWPLFTGWNAVAQYRNGRPLAGALALRQNLNLTWAQDPGAVTEVLSGRFYEPLGRSSTHQLWSSAMALTPTLRELFGVEPDATHNTLFLHPHLPPTWPQATLDNVQVGPTLYTLTYRRQGPTLEVTASSPTPTSLCLVNAPEIPTTPEPPSLLQTLSSRPKRNARSGETCGSVPATTHTLRIPLPALELSMPDTPLPAPGSETTQPHILAEHTSAHEASFTLEAPGGTTVTLHVTRNTPASRNARTADGQLTADTLKITLPQGTGWAQKAVTITF